MKIIVNILIEAVTDVFNYIISKLTTIATMFEVALPFVMLYIGESVMEQRGSYKVGSEIAVPIIIGFIIWFIRKCANKLGKGTTMPMPVKRFTSIDEDNCVSIEHKRVQELLLFTNDLENWLEQKGYK